MRVAIFSNARTGSTTLYKYLTKSLDYYSLAPPFDRKFFNLDFKSEVWTRENVVVKFMFEFLPIVDRIQKSFDKTIFLTRTNDAEGAESLAHAMKTGVWNRPYVSINFTKEEIDKYISIRKQQREKIQSLGGFQITYEEIFYSDTGVKRLNDFFGISTDQFAYLLDNRHRLKKLK